MHKLKQVFKTVLWIIILLAGLTRVEAAEPAGTLSGQVRETGSRRPVAGAVVRVAGTNHATICTEKGEFEIKDIRAGNYRVTVSCPGFETAVKTDIHIRPQRITRLETELKPQSGVLKTEEVTVKASYFHERKTEPHGTVNLSNEEVRRSAGTAGDVTRVLKIMPGTGSLTDQRNDLVVRGGSPAENLFMIDNMEIPNINQFPQLGSSGGLISIINPDFLQNVDFYPGGFSAAYGDRLSSVVDMTFREGNRREFDGQLDLNVGGFGGVFEGPVNGGKGSWLISGRRSYLDVILKMMGRNFGPSYADFQGKFSYGLGNGHKIDVLNIFGTSNLDFDKENSIEDGRDIYGNFETWQNTVGMNWIAPWNDSFFSTTSISYSFVKSKSKTYRVFSDINNIDLDYVEDGITLRNVNYLTLNGKNKLRFGFTFKREMADYNYYFAGKTDEMGNSVPGSRGETAFSASKWGAHAIYTWSPAYWFTANIGLRADYFGFNRHFYLSPRVSLAFRANSRLSFNVGAGVYYQTIPRYFLSQDESYKDLKDPRAVHYTAGLEYFITPSTRLTLEVYDKEYANQPIDPGYPYVFIADSREMTPPGVHRRLSDNGAARSYGVELMIQKKLRDKFYGILSASYFRSRYRDYYGTWRNRVYDNRFLFNLVGGYKPDRFWEFSVNWTFMGGVPYTPADMEKSLAANEYIIDRNRINGDRLPDYNSLNIRAERRFYFRGAALVVYLDVWNVFNRDNVYMYYWNQIEQDTGTRYQFSFLPVLGVEFEF